uniref:Thioredoxin-like fold domain-containing protein n=1 Tax=Florenciella sp. virus SA2 TaxID=3240092 RepID=A0AB39JCG8_9VIRU
MNNSNTNILPDKNLNSAQVKHLLFYSEYCNHSKELLSKLKQKDLLNKIVLINIDNRYVKNNLTYLIINNKETMPLPPMITCVPTMCITPAYEILQGEKILEYFLPIVNNIEDEKTMINIEPNSYSLENETIGQYGVSSDNYSYWDTDPDDLSAKGNGGLKQMYNYASIDNNDTEIYTPPDLENSNKSSLNIDEIQQQRNNEL